MPPLLRARAPQVGLAIVLVVMAAVGFVPLFDGPGYESALAAGLLVPSVAAIATALHVRSARPAPIDALGLGLVIGAALALAAYATTLLHGLRAGFCDVAGGTWLFALGPAFGALAGGAWGAVAGTLVGARCRRRPRLAAASLALAGPLVSALASVARFYTSPMVFAYDPFVGHFSGTLYDTIIDGSGLVTYRAGTVATLAAAAVLALHCTSNDSLRPRSLGRPGLVALGLAAALASVAVTLSGPRLGHWQTASTIAETLGGERRGARCDVVHPRAMDAGYVTRFTRDCDALVAAEEVWLGVTARATGAAEPSRLRAYLFESVDQKAALMGAEHTQIAKPWRREIYVQQAGYPHPSLGHEIAHVLAGSLARGPFLVAGSLGGLVPDPGLIEGIAVAAAPPEGDLTPRQWARAMKDLALLPPLSRLFALGFLGESSSTAYTASGAFVAYVRDRHGVDAVARWYGGDDLEAITGEAWGAVEAAWHADLDTVTLPPAALAHARARFGRPAIFGRRCPHEVDACAARADGLAAAGDVEGALAGYDEVIALDPTRSSARVSAALVRMRSGDVDAARIELERVADDEDAEPYARDRAIEALGDAALEAGHFNAAIARYRELEARTTDEDRKRTLDVKAAAAIDPDARAAVIELLIGRAGKAPDRVHAAELLGIWTQRSPDDGLPLYLSARYFVGTGDLGEARDRLDRALARRLDVPRVATEAHRLAAVIACGLGDAAAARGAFAAYAGRPDVSEARREALARLVERCDSSGLD